MPTVPGLPARTLAAGAVGVVLAAALGGCSGSTPRSSGGATTGTSAASSPSPSPSPSVPASASVSPSAIATYVDKIPAELRASLFTQGSVPASYADWISTSPQQQNVNGQIEVKVDRRLPPCTKDPTSHFDADQHAAGFAARLFQAGDFIVARQLTVYPSTDQAKAAVGEMVDKNAGCSTLDGKAVVGSMVGDLVDAGELDIPQHDGTVAGESAVSVGGNAGASWWTVIGRENNAVVLTRVVDPHANVDDKTGSTDDSIKLRQAVLAQARTSATALDHFAG